MVGVVERVGVAVTAFHPGDEVFGMVGGVGGLQGTLADFIWGVYKTRLHTVYPS